MSKDNSETVVWTGASGDKYTYFVWSLPASIKSGQPGNYIYVKIKDGKWVPVYIGQGDLGDRVGESHHKWDCIKSKGATHVHVHKNNSEAARKNEEADLLERYSQAYAPTGCNEKEGG